MKLRCLRGHDWEYRIDDVPVSHGEPPGYRDVWAKCLRCGKAKFLHSGVFVFRTYNRPAQSEETEHE